ncbi:MAG: hypothetical protein Q8Q02_06360 [Nocardioides sp.]|nr:hypothetical protein [Nocardioides sp.]
MSANAGWTLGYVIGLVVVVVVVALVVPILLLAHRIGDQAGVINESLAESVTNTAGLAGLRTTIEHAGAIVAGLHRGRERLGG